MVAGLGLMRTSLAARSDRHRRREEHGAALLAQLTCISEGIGKMAREMHRANLIQHYRLTADQLERAIDDPSLATSLSTLADLSAAKRRQLLFANRQYALTLLAHRVGALDWDELIGTLRVLATNAVFAEYWEHTGDHRRSLPEESLEARVGRIVDAIVEELAEDPDEWWVVGTTSGNGTGAEHSGPPSAHDPDP